METVFNKIIDDNQYPKDVQLKQETNGEINGEINEEIKAVLLLIQKNAGIKAKTIALGVSKPKKTLNIIWKN